MDYAALAKTGDKLLRQFGVSVKITRLGVSVGTGYGVFTMSEAKDETTSQSSLLAQTSSITRSLLLSGLAKAPQVGDVVTADKDSWTVEAVEVVRPGSTTVLYKLVVQ